MARQIKLVIRVALAFAIGASISNLITKSFTKTSTALKVRSNQIFFQETTESASLNYRQICAVESAARQNPDRQIQLFLTSSSINQTSSFYGILSRYWNINISRVDLADYFTDGPFEQWYETGDWKRSPFSHIHLSDYMRVLTLWKAGGLYLDLDFIVIKSLANSVFNNFIGLQDDSSFTFANGAMHFDQHSPLLELIIHRMVQNYSADSWAGNGPELIASVVKEACRLPGGRWNTEKKTVDCGDFGTVSLLPHRMFYPVNYPSWSDIFDKYTSRRSLSAFRSSYAVHVWNKLSRDTPVLKGSNQMYALLAEKYCPLTYKNAPDVF